jgi:archaellin
LTVSVTAVAGQVTDATIVDAGDGYETGADTVLISYCVGTEDGLATLDIDSLHEQITINITNTGSEAVELNRIYITLSDTGDYNQGIPFQFSSHYYGSNLFIFPGEYIESSPFGLENTTHGLAVDADPDRAFLSVYDYSSAIPVTDS